MKKRNRLLRKAGKTQNPIHWTNIDTSETETMMKSDAPERDSIKILHHRLIKQYHQVHFGGLLNPELNFKKKL